MLPIIFHILSLSLYFFSFTDSPTIDEIPSTVYFLFQSLVCKSLYAQNRTTKSLFGYPLFLKTKNWKHYSKIIFKCVNNTIGPNFNENFVEKSTCGSREQCTGPTELDAYAVETSRDLLSWTHTQLKPSFSSIQTHTKSINYFTIFLQNIDVTNFLLVFI